MSIKSLKHSISSLKLAKKSSSAIFNDSTFSALVSRYFDSDTPYNALIDPSINNSSNSIYYNTLLKIITEKNTAPIEIKAIALKFQKILSLEIEQASIERLLNRKYADHINNSGGAYDIFHTELECLTCRTQFTSQTHNQVIPSLNVNLLPTVCMIWHPSRLIKNFETIGKLVNNPFKATNNNNAELIFPLNLVLVNNGNHSTNTSIYENDSNISDIYCHDVSKWFDDIFFDPQSNTFNHATCDKQLTPAPLFHENIGYIYEISRLLYHNNIYFSLNDII